jgi:hypothetical protein
MGWLILKQQPPRRITMDIRKTVLFAAPAALMTVNLAEVEQAQAKRRATADRLNTKDPDLRKEFNALRARLYGLTQDAKNAEVYCNTQAVG